VGRNDRHHRSRFVRHLTRPRASHTWTVTVDNDDLDAPVTPVEANASLPLRALGGGSYAVIVVGTYGRAGASWRDNQPIIGYAGRFTLQGGPLPLVPTNTVRDVTRDGNAVTVTMGEVDSSHAITVARRASPATERGNEPPRYITESLYGHPVLRNALAHVEAGVERLTVRTNSIPDPAMVSGWTFSYAGRTYEAAERD